MGLSSCAYYNTFFNTKKIYGEARKEREKRQGDKPTSKELQLYDKVIEKASKILEVYPNSKYVDDAIMILGESFYYKGNYIKAQRKYRELITYFPKSKYLGRAKLWLAKTSMKLNDYDQAQLMLKELLESPKTKRRLLQEGALLLGDIHFDKGEYDKAEAKYQSVVEGAKEKEIRAQALFKLGQTQLKNAKFAGAIESFRQATKYSPDRSFEFDAEMNLGIALKLAGDYDHSIRICNSLLENTSFKKKHGLVRLELADCKYRTGKSMREQLREASVDYLGKIDEAVDEYNKITKEYKRSEVSARAYFELGKIYEDDFGDFVKAKENYERVRTEYGRFKHLKEANQKARSLGELIRLQNKIQSIYGRGGKQFGSGSDQLTEMEMLLLEQGVHPEFRFLQKQKQLARKKQSSEAAQKAAKAARELNEGEIISKKLQLAQLYLFQFGKVDSALNEYNRILAAYPNREEAASALYSLAFIYENVYQNKAKTDSLLHEVVQRFPQSEQAGDARRKLGLRPLMDARDYAAELYESAERTLFNDHNLAAAIRTYQKVVDQYPDSEYAPRSLYAVGWIYENKMFENERAIQTYQELLEKYPESEVSKKIKSKLGAVANAAKKKEAEAKKQALEQQKQETADTKQPEPEGAQPEPKKAMRLMEEINSAKKIDAQQKDSDKNETHNRGEKKIEP
ncbi:MAG: tetratricopeptide repeat protein [bacterium]